MAHSGPARAMAGSIARGDIATVRRHLAALDALDASIAELYRALARRTVPLALAAGGITPERALELETLLERPS